MIKYLLLFVGFLTIGSVSIYADSGNVVDDKIEQPMNAAAQFQLAETYRSKGGDDNEKLAVFWYEKAAQNGEKAAQSMMSLIYYFGIFKQQDTKQAYAWATVAGKQGNKDAEGAAKDYAKELSAEELKKAKILAETYIANYIKQ